MRLLHSLLIRQISRNPKPPWTSSSLHTYFSSSSSSIPDAEESVISDEVLTILKTVNPMEKALEPMVPFLSPHIVSNIISNPPNPQLGFRFFIWATKYERFRSRANRELIFNSLVKEEGGLELYWQTIQELKRWNAAISSESFNVLIQAFFKMDMEEKAVEAFGMMREFGCEPDLSTYNLVLHALSRREVFFLALSVYSLMLKFNCKPDVVTFSILIDGLCKNGQTGEAMQMFDEMTQRGILPNKFTYTVIISGLCHGQMADEAYRLFKSMKDSGCKPDVVTYNALLNGFARLGRLDEAFALLKSFQQDGYVIGLHGYSCLFDALFKAGRYEEAQVWYEKMIESGIQPDSVCYAIMMRGLSAVGKLKDAVHLLNEMNERGVVPDIYCYNALIKGYCDAGLLDRAQSLRLEILQRNGFPNAATHTILICSMHRNRLLDEAEKIFNEMEEHGCYPSVVTFNALIHGFCEAGNLDKAQFLFSKMQIGRNPSLFLLLSQGANPVLDSASLRKWVEELCHSGLILKAYKLLMKIADSGVVPDIRTYNVLINGFCKAGKIDGALNLFKELQKKGLSPDVVTYGTLIKGFQMANREKDAFAVLDQMQKNGCRPTAAVYKSLMTWSTRRKNVSLAFSLWLEYLRQTAGREEEPIKAIEEQFGKGEVELAVRGLLEMDFKLNDFQLAPYTIWLIGMCRVGRIEEALKIFSILKELKILVTPPSCEKLIAVLCKKRNLDPAIDVFLYTIDKGYLLKRRTCNRILKSLLCSKDKKSYAFDLLRGMESLKCNLGAYLSKSTKALLRGQFDMQGKEIDQLPLRDSEGMQMDSQDMEMENGLEINCK